MLKSLAVTFSVFLMPLALWADQPAVRVEPSNLQGPRPLEAQTATEVIRDYLQSWQSMSAALEQNRPDLLDASFVGTARDKLADTIQQQTALGLRTRYQDRSHDVRIIFYSPEGLSIQLVDNVEYDQQVLDRDKILTTQPERARYIVILTPAEVHWRVRIFQASTE
jgi:hypothetical protein